MDGERAESRTGLGGVITGVGCDEHASARTCERRQARPVDLRSDPQARHGDLLRPHEVDDPREVAGVDAAESGAVTDVDDRPRAVRAIELADGLLQNGQDVGRAEGRAGIENEASLLQGGAVGVVESVGQKLAVHIHGRDREPIGGPGGIEKAVEGTQRSLPVPAGLARRGIDEHEHIDRLGCRRLCGPQSHGSDLRLDR